MGRQVRRQHQFRALKERSSDRAGLDASYLIDWHEQTLSSKERSELFFAAATGLIQRFSRTRGEKYGVFLTEALSYSWVTFKRDVAFHGIKKATENVIAIMGLFSQADIRRVMKPTPFALLKEASEFQNRLPPRKQNSSRRQFLKSLHMEDETSLSDSDLIEQYLADKYFISTSEVHKLLAMATKPLRTQA